MPTYEYKCRACGHTFDIVQKMSDDPLTHCPECAGELRKVFAAPAISFKGSGFYATDHGKQAEPSSGTDKADTGKADTGTKDTGTKGSGSDAKEGGSTGDAGSGSTSSGSDKKEGSTP